MSSAVKESIEVLLAWKFQPDVEGDRGVSALSKEMSKRFSDSSDRGDSSFLENWKSRSTTSSQSDYTDKSAHIPAQNHSQKRTLNSETKSPTRYTENSVDQKLPTEYQRVVDGRRRLVVLSCAECRRLKLKCSRQFPCTNCVKRGREAICPDGSLATGKGNRFVLAHTESLHEKINLLSTRARLLEDALEQSHSECSAQLHPLLTPELRNLKKPLEHGKEDGLLISLGTRGPAPNVAIQREDMDEEIGTSGGSLSMAQPGRINYHGSSANAFALLLNEENDELVEDDETDCSLPDSSPWFSHSFPFGPNIRHVARSIREKILTCLPEISEARELSEFYFQHGAWMYTPVSESEYRDEIFSLFYEHTTDFSEQDPSEAYKLAILFFVFAMGKILDLRGRDIKSHEAMRYYQIGKVALTLDSFLDARSIPALQALLLMCHFMLFANIENSRWAIMGVAVKLAENIGLHRDGTKFNLSVEDTQKRRTLMWEIYTYDSWQSLTFGRPTSFALSSIDCEMAYETTRNAKGEIEMSFAAWKHRFSAQCLSKLHDEAYGARTTGYKHIQELDKLVRDFYIPPSLQVPGFGGNTLMSLSGSGGPPGESERPSLQLAMQRYIALSIKEIC